MIPLTIDLQKLESAARSVAQSHDLSLVILFGSAAHLDQERDPRDLDLAVQGNSGGVDSVALTNAFIQELGIQDVDLVDLRRADPLILQLVAEEGRMLHEAEPGIHARFCSLAARRYADTRKFREMERREIREWLARAPANRTYKKDDVG